MHLGHMKLVEVAKQRALETNAKTALFTFSNDVFPALGKSDKAVYTFEERLELYSSLGVDYVLAADFDDKFRAQSGKEFVRKLTEYNLTGIVCGFDYTFGCTKNNCDDLVAFVNGVVPVDVVQPVCRDGVKVSTTLVRRLLSECKIESASELMREPFFLTGTVCHGRRVGSEMGFPTANVAVSEDKFLPEGVFGGYAEVDGKRYNAIVNVGQRPTFGLNDVFAEAHLIGFCGDLYGRKIKVSLTKFLRPIQKFTDKEQLAAQLRKDRERLLND